jgi:hypothetical protein
MLHRFEGVFCVVVPAAASLAQVVTQQRPAADAGPELMMMMMKARHKAPERAVITDQLAAPSRSESLRPHGRLAWQQQHNRAVSVAQGFPRPLMATLAR